MISEKGFILENGTEMSLVLAPIWCRRKKSFWMP